MLAERQQPWDKRRQGYPAAGVTRTNLDLWRTQMQEAGTMERQLLLEEMHDEEREREDILWLPSSLYS